MWKELSLYLKQVTLPRESNPLYFCLVIPELRKVGEGMV